MCIQITDNNNIYILLLLPEPPWGSCDVSAIPVVECETNCLVRQIALRCGCHVTYAADRAGNASLDVCSLETLLTCVREVEGTRMHVRPTANLALQSS